MVNVWAMQYAPEVAAYVGYVVAFFFVLGLMAQNPKRERSAAHDVPTKGAKDKIAIYKAYMNDHVGR